jgi:hypothetical protein
MPVDQACQLMTVDVSQAIMNTASTMCQASANICTQAFQMMSNEASEFLRLRCLKQQQTGKLTGEAHVPCLTA